LHSDLNTTSDTADDEHKPVSVKSTKTAQTLLVEAVLDAAVTGRLRRRLDARGVVAIIVVPDITWVTATRAHLDGRYPHDVVVSITEKPKRYGSATDFRSAYGLGRTVMAVTQDPALLPEELTTAADLTIRLAAPDANVIRRVINRVTGGRARGLGDADLAGRSLSDLVAAIRPYSSAARCVARLRAPRTSLTATSTSPDLSVLPLFGEARVWASQALHEAGRLMRGEISSRDIEATLLYGPPGTGKTVLAGALARSAGMAFVSTSVADWFVQSDGGLGGVLRKGDAFFQQVLANAPAVGFLDEIDALPDRATLEPDRREWWQSVVTGVMLMVTRTLASDKKIMLVAATNHPDHLDAALKRPGRFGRHVRVRPAETEEEVAAILAYHLRDDLDADAVARLAAVAGIPTAAEVEGWVKAARGVARAADRPLSAADVLAQLAPESDDRSADELRLTALHEAAHAVAALHFGFELKRVTITGRGAIGGSTTWRPTGNVTRLDSIENQAVVTLAGRAADVVLGGSADGGAVADLTAVTTLLVTADASLGLRDTLVSRGAEVATLLRSDPALLRRTDEHLKRLLARATALVGSRRTEIGALADALLARRILSGSDVKAILGAIPRKQPAGTAELDAEVNLPTPDETDAAAAQPKELK